MKLDHTKPTPLPWTFCPGETRYHLYLYANGGGETLYGIDTNHPNGRWTSIWCKRREDAQFILDLIKRDETTRTLLEECKMLAVMGIGACAETNTQEYRDQLIKEIRALHAKIDAAVTPQDAASVR